MLKKIYENKSSLINLVFIGGWNFKGELLSIIYNYFDNHNVFLAIIPVDNDIDRIYNLDDYLLELSADLKDIDNPILIGYSFGGKLAAFLSFIYHYQIILIAPSLISNNYIFTKIKIKINKIFHLKLFVSKDYRHSKGKLRKTFLNIVHVYLSRKEQLTLKSTIILFKKDKEVFYKAYLKKFPSSKIYILKGNHYGFIENSLRISLIIKEQLSI